jgi:hypothetical protein
MTETTYREILARRPEPRRVEYISQEDYRRQKTALTRAVNTGDPAAILKAVERAVEAWAGKAWPDDWNRWRIALGDAAWAARRSGDDDLAAELFAAEEVLFP